MSPIITYVLLLCMGLYVITILVELAVSRAVKRFLIQAVILVVVFGLLNVTTDFPATRQAFGVVSPILAIVIMFLCVLLGIVAHYFFHFKGSFSWGSFFKPLIISPIVLLPLIGSVQGSSNIESIKLISLAFLAFQNGFFWKVVIEHARSQI